MHGNAVNVEYKVRLFLQERRAKMEGHWILLLEVPTGACGKYSDCVAMNG